MERENYLRYFNHSNKKSLQNLKYYHHPPLNQSKSLHLNKSKVEKKLLPHIAEEYQYKITNQLLVQKIINPKRDKLIIQSFHRIPSRINTRKQKSRDQTIIYKDRQPQSLDLKRTQNQEKPSLHSSLYSRIRIRKDKQNSKQKSIKNHVQQFNLALENERMGRRIIKTKSSVEELLKKSFFTYKNKQSNKENQQTDMMNSFLRGKDKAKIYFSGKINNGVKVFFNPVKDDSKLMSRSQSAYQTKRSQKSQQNQKQEEGPFQTTFQSSFRKKELRKNKTAINLKHRLMKIEENDANVTDHIETNHPQSFKIYGKGPTILMIQNLEIISNPPIKDCTMIILELITHETRITLKQTKQKSIKTIPLPYEFIKPSQNSNNSSNSNCIRFAINVSSIGDFVPMRIYKVNGVDIQQLGIIDIDLAAFRYRKQQFGEDQSNQMLMKQQKLSKNGQKMQRDIISGKAQGKLRKKLLYKPVETIVNLNYKIYPKKYKLKQQLWQ